MDMTIDSTRDMLLENVQHCDNNGRYRDPRQSRPNIIMLKDI